MRSMLKDWRAREFQFSAQDYDGMIHDFFLLLGVIDRAWDVMADACNSTRDALIG